MESSPVGATLAVAQNVLPQSSTVGAGFTPAQIRETTHGQSFFGYRYIGQSQFGQPQGLPLQICDPSTIRATARVAPTDTIDNWATAWVAPTIDMILTED